MRQEARGKVWRACATPTVYQVYRSVLERPSTSCRTELIFEFDGRVSMP